MGNAQGGHSMSGDHRRARPSSAQAQPARAGERLAHGDQRCWRQGQGQGQGRQERRSRTGRWRWRRWWRRHRCHGRWQRRWSAGRATGRGCVRARLGGRGGRWRGRGWRRRGRCYAGGATAIGRPHHAFRRVLSDRGTECAHARAARPVAGPPPHDGRAVTHVHLPCAGPGLRTIFAAHHPSAAAGAAHMRGWPARIHPQSAAFACGRHAPAREAIPRRPSGSRARVLGRPPGAAPASAAPPGGAERGAGRRVPSILAHHRAAAGRCPR
mmetsp:Transcript_1102/g.4400  ORF Transcript_1102/g.4400 Transcript_1102/m.4400 type:complete len:269 (+) Transcript_1102:2786-3592(+)